MPGLLIGCLNAFASDTLSESTLVVYNSGFPGSRSLAEYYTSKRGIPKDQAIGLDCPILEVRNLTELGSHFPAALEVLGLVQACQHDENAALATLETAKKAYGNEPEKFRCVLDQAEILQSQERADRLAELIHKALDTFKATEQQEILKRYLR